MNSWVKALKQSKHHERDPPALQSAVDHEPSQKKSDQQRPPEIETALVDGRRSCEAEEKKESSEKQRRVVRRRDRPCQKQHMDDGNPARNRQQPETVWP